MVSHTARGKEELQPSHQAKQGPVGPEKRAAMLACLTALFRRIAHPTKDPQHHEACRISCTLASVALGRWRSWTSQTSPTM